MNVIYTIAYGSDCWHQAVLMVQSVRRRGKFTGDIIVFSDTRADMMGAKVITDLTPLAFYSPKLAKAWLGMTYDFSVYDRIAFFDADIVAIRPVTPLFEPQGIRACWDGVHEWAENDQHHFNSGTIIAPTAGWKSLCAQWFERLCVTRPEGAWVDQPAFNWLIQQGAIKVQPLPSGSVHLFTSALTSEAVLIHCTYPNKMQNMDAFFHLTHHEEDIWHWPVPDWNNIAQ